MVVILFFIAGVLVYQVDTELSLLISQSHHKTLIMLIYLTGQMKG